VLVGIPKVVKDNERVALRGVPSLVELNRLDLCPCLATDPAEFVSSRFVEAFRRFLLENWKPLPIPASLQRLAVDEHELPNQVFERRAEVVDDLSNQDAQTGVGFRQMDVEDILIRLGLELSGDSIRAEMEPRAGFRIERFKVFPCPLALFEAAV